MVTIRSTQIPGGYVGTIEASRWRMITKDIDLAIDHAISEYLQQCYDLKTKRLAYIIPKVSLETDPGNGSRDKIVLETLPRPKSGIIVDESSTFMTSVRDVDVTGETEDADNTSDMSYVNGDLNAGDKSFNRKQKGTLLNWNDNKDIVEELLMPVQKMSVTVTHRIDSPSKPSSIGPSEEMLVTETASEIVNEARKLFLNESIGRRIRKPDRVISSKSLQEIIKPSAPYSAVDYSQGSSLEKMFDDALEQQFFPFRSKNRAIVRAEKLPRIKTEKSQPEPKTTAPSFGEFSSFVLQSNPPIYTMPPRASPADIRTPLSRVTVLPTRPARVPTRPKWQPSSRLRRYMQPRYLPESSTQESVLLSPSDANLLMFTGGDYDFERSEAIEERTDEYEESSAVEKLDVDQRDTDMKPSSVAFVVETKRLMQVMLLYNSILQWRSNLIDLVYDSFI
jgi:hypothetical protein